MNKHRGSSIDDFLKASHYFGPPDNPSLIVAEHDSGVFISSLKPAFYDADQAFAIAGDLIAIARRIRKRARAVEASSE